MNMQKNEAGGVLIAALLVGLLLALLGGVAMNLAATETMASGRHLEEKTVQLLAESGVEQAAGWLTHGGLPASGSVPAGFTGTAGAPDVEYDAKRPADARLLNGNGMDTFAGLAEFGRIVRMRLYGAGRPEGFCTVEVTAESRNGVRRTASVQLGAYNTPPLRAAVQLGAIPESASESDHGVVPQVLTHWSAVQEPVQGLPPSPWQYEAWKDLAKRIGAYYVPDREGRLYQDGIMEAARARVPSEVLGSRYSGDQRGLVFIDTLDQEPPAGTNLANLVLGSEYMEGTFYINANVVLQPQSPGLTIPALSPPAEGPSEVAARVPVQLSDVTIQGVLYTSGTLRIEGQPRVFGAVVAERGLIGSGLLEVWYNADLGRGRVRGLPVVFPLRGTWREWGN